MSLKNIKKMRVKKYFIEACKKIICEEGLENVTIRKISELAGYNSGTLYNYFANLDELLVYTSCSFLQDYLHKLKNIGPFESHLERYTKIWELFAEEGFKNANFYNILFFKHDFDEGTNPIKSYYELYPDQLEGIEEALIPMLTEVACWKRDFEILKTCSESGYIKYDDVIVISQMISHIFDSMVYRASQEENPNVAEYTDRLMFFLKRILSKHVTKEVNFL